MTAVIQGTVTREQAGLRSPRSRSSNITPARGGCVTHWGGTRQRIGPHSRCLVIWKAWQDYHMRPGGLGTRDGAADIAYNFGYCNHGYVFVGRGWGVRSGANGTSDGNQNYYAFVWIGGVGDGRPTREALDALDWLVNEARLRGAGSRARPHQDFTGTSCSGDYLIFYTRSIDNKAVSLPAAPASNQKPTSEEEEMSWQQAARQWAMGLRLTDGSRPSDPATREQLWQMLRSYDATIDGDFLRAQKTELAKLEPATNGSALRWLIQNLRASR